MKTINFAQKIPLVLLIILTSLQALSITIIDIKNEPAPHLSGRELCNMSQNHRPGELGTFITVPFDYDNPSEKTTEIFFWTYSEFDPEKPSVVYINGGPGGSTHSTRIQAFEDWNVIYFDQRGIACSRPATEADYKNPKYLDSKIIAQDIEEIRRYLKIPQWSVYGHSYGTVPATIYSHLYPQATKALVLEGVIDQGDINLYRSPRRKFLSQKFVETLNEEQLYKLNYIAENFGREYFSTIIFSFMYSDLPFEKALNFLNQFKPKEVISKNLILNTNKISGNDILKPELLKTLSSGSEFLDLLYYSEANWITITCKELKSTEIESYFFHQWLQNQKFDFVLKTEDFEKRKQDCQNYNLTDEHIKPYQSHLYPIHVPTTYFQGTSDGATEATKASRHYKHSAKSKKQLLLKVNGGHSPISKSLKVLSTESSQTAVSLAKINMEAEILKKALRGDFININEINASLPNQDSELKWVGTHKNFSPQIKK